ASLRGRHARRQARDLRGRPARGGRARVARDRTRPGEDARAEAGRPGERPRRGAPNGARDREGRMRLIEREVNGARVVFSTRLGGVSAGPYESLNLGILTGDAADRVTENRTRLALGAGLEPESIAMGWQVHGTDLR